MANLANPWTIGPNYISGNGGLVVSGNALLTVNGPNNYTGGTTITGGTVSLGTNGDGNESNLGLGSGPVSLGKAELVFGGSSGGVVNYSFSNNVAVNGGVLYAQYGYQSLTGTVNVGTNGATVYTQNSGHDVAIANVSGSGNLTIDSLGAGARGSSIWAVPETTTEPSR